MLELCSDTAPSPAGCLLVSEASRRLGLSEAAVRDLFDSGELRGHRNAAGYRLIDAESVTAFGHYLSVGQAARMLGISEGTVRQYFDEGLLRGRRTEQGHRRITLESAMILARTC